MSGSYWQQVHATGLAVPTDRPLDDLTAELTRMLGDPDPALRDGTAYPTLTTWVDRGVGPRQAPIPSLLATAGVHHHLVREGTRTRCALVIESGDAREVHHVSLLLGYGAGVVNPYVAFETIDDMIRSGMLTGIDRDKAIQHYIKALNKGVLKEMSKMGI